MPSADKGHVYLVDDDPDVRKAVGLLLISRGFGVRPFESGEAFLASANLTRSTSLRFAARRTLEFCRTVPEIVFALMFVYAFGFGPMPGVLAIAIHTAGALGKQYSEVVENVNMQPVEGLTAAAQSFKVGPGMAAVMATILGSSSARLISSCAKTLV